MKYAILSCILALTATCILMASTSQAPAQSYCDYSYLFSAEQADSNYFAYYELEQFVGIEQTSSGNVVRAGQQLSRNPIFFHNLGTAGPTVICNRTGDFGILTNAHVALSYNIYSGWNRIGRSVDERGSVVGPDSTGLDASFIKFANQNNWTPTPAAVTIPYYRIRLATSTQMSQLRAGDNIVMIGARSGRQEGTIRTPSWTEGVLAPWRYWLPQIEMNIFAQQGDSGSPIFLTRNSNYYLIGMLWGRVDNQHIRTAPLANRIHSVISALNLTIYCLDIHNLDFTVLGDEVTVTGITRGRTNISNIRIPSHFRGRPVTRIASQAFANTNIISIYIPNTVTYIGAGAFMSSSLQSVNLSLGVYQIKELTFFNTNLQSVSIPNRVTYIGEFAFSFNTNLSFVNFAPGSRLSRIGNETFSGTSLNNIILPSSLESIGRQAFDHTPFWFAVPNNTPVYVGNWLVGARGMPTGVYSVRQNTIGIADDALVFNGGFNALTLPNTLRYIGFRSLAWTNITEITIPNSVRRIDALAFNGSERLATVRMQSSDLQVPSLGSEAFAGASNILRIYVPMTSFRAFSNSPYWRPFAMLNRLRPAPIMMGPATQQFTTQIERNATMNIPIYFIGRPYTGLALQLEGLVGSGSLTIINCSGGVAHYVSDGQIVTFSTLSMRRYYLSLRGASAQNLNTLRITIKEYYFIYIFERFGRNSKSTHIGVDSSSEYSLAVEISGYYEVSVEGRALGLNIYNPLGELIDSTVTFTSRRITFFASTNNFYTIVVTNLTTFAQTVVIGVDFIPPPAPVPLASATSQNGYSSVNLDISLTKLQGRTIKVVYTVPSMPNNGGYKWIHYNIFNSTVGFEFGLDAHLVFSWSNANVLHVWRPVGAGSVFTVSFYCLDAYPNTRQSPILFALGSTGGGGTWVALPVCCCNLTGNQIKVMYINTSVSPGMVYTIVPSQSISFSGAMLTMPNGTVLSFSWPSFVAITSTPTNSTFWEIRLYKV